MHHTRFLAESLDKKTLRIVALQLSLVKELEQEHGAYDLVALGDAASDAVDIFPGLDQFLEEQNDGLDWDDINESLFDTAPLEGEFNHATLSFARSAASWGARFFINGKRLVLDDIDELEGILEKAENYDAVFGAIPQQDDIKVFDDGDGEDDDEDDEPTPRGGHWLH